jgi:hypothetical protein
VEKSGLDLTVGETRNVLASIAQEQPDEVEEWAIILRMRCQECRTCDGGATVVLSSSVHDAGTDKAAIVRLAADAIKDLTS